MKKYYKAIATLPGGALGLGLAEMILKALCNADYCLDGVQALGVQTLVVILCCAGAVYISPKNQQ